MWSLQRLVICKESSFVLKFASLCSRNWYHNAEEEYFPKGLSREVFRLGLRNDVDGLWELLQELSVKDEPQGMTPQFLDDAAFILSETQSKRGIMLISSLAQRHFPEHFDAMSGYMTFQPVKWHAIQLNQSVKHFEDLYMIKQPKAKAQLGRTFRSGLLRSYLNIGLTSEFLVLHNFVNDIWYFWKDKVPMVAFWEVLFCSPKEEDQKFAKELWRLNHKLITEANLFPSLIFTLYEMGDYRKLTLLRDFIQENRQHFSPLLLSGLKNVIADFIVEMDFLKPLNRYSLQFSMERALMSELRKKHIYLNARNPKRYFLTMLPIDQVIAPPIPVQVHLK